MKGIIAIVAPDRGKLDNLLRAAPDDVEVKWIDSTQPTHVQAEQMSDVVAMLQAAGDFDMDLARSCPRLKLIQVTSAGVDRFDVAALGEMGIRVANNHGGNANAVAEHAVALMITVLRKLTLQFESVRAGKWMGAIRQDWTPRAYEISGKTVGIVGLGQIGLRVAQRLQGWECSTIFHDPVQPEAELVADLGLRAVSMDDLVQESDIVTLHAPLNPRTRGLVGKREFGLMKSTAILINTCRGGVVEESSLIEALRAGKIAGAGLDVLDQEPTQKDNPLLSMNNVAVTPHLAGMSAESGPRSVTFAMQNMARVARGEEPLSVVTAV